MYNVHASISAGEAVERATVYKGMKYSTSTNAHTFVVVALESGGAWCRDVVHVLVGKSDKWS